MTLSTFFRRTGVPAILIGGGALFLIGCAGKPKYKKIAQTDAKIATPPHNLPPGEYPFDDDGRYRKDWVANPKSAKRTPAKRSTPAPTVTASAPPPPAFVPQPSPPAHAPPPAYSAASTPPRQQVAPVPKPAPAKPARYHTVAKGDTLYSLSRKYGVTVAKMKSTNGLTSDTIRLGQTLRVP